MEPEAPSAPRKHPQSTEPGLLTVGELREALAGLSADAPVWIWIENAWIGPTLASQQPSNALVLSCDIVGIEEAE